LLGRYSRASYSGNAHAAQRELPIPCGSTSPLPRPNSVGLHGPSAFPTQRHLPYSPGAGDAPYSQSRSVKDATELLPSQRVRGKYCSSARFCRRPVGQGSGMVQGMGNEPCHKPLWLSEHFPPVTAYTRRTFMTIGIALNARRVGWGDPHYEPQSISQNDACSPPSRQVRENTALPSGRGAMSSHGPLSSF
jgi:hypothetical protein